MSWEGDEYGYVLLVDSMIGGHFLFKFLIFFHFSTFFLKIRNDKKRGKILIIKNGHKKDGEFVY